jgi:hypothetical protein
MRRFEKDFKRLLGIGFFGQESMDLTLTVKETSMGIPGFAGIHMHSRLFCRYLRIV